MKSTTLICTACILTATFAARADAVTYEFKDNFWGYAQNGFGDIIAKGGSQQAFSVGSIAVSNNQGGLSISVIGSYFDATSGNKLGTTMGDLFISTNGWNPHTAPDEYKNYGWYTPPRTPHKGEDWEYVFALDHRSIQGGNSDSGTFNVYRLPLPNTLNAIDLTLGSGIWLNSYQEWKANDAWKSGQPVLASGTWSRQGTGTATNANFENDTSYLRFDLSTLGFLTSDDLAAREWGYHWTMSCGNDAIEGATPNPAAVPEPSTLLLLGAGLLGAAGYLRGKRRR